MYLRMGLSRSFLVCLLVTSGALVFVAGQNSGDATPRAPNVLDASSQEGSNASPPVPPSSKEDGALAARDVLHEVPIDESRGGSAVGGGPAFDVPVGGVWVQKEIDADASEHAAEFAPHDVEHQGTPAREQQCDHPAEDNCNAVDPDGKSGGSERAANVSAGADLLDAVVEELQATDALIGQLSRKMELLERLRVGLLAGHVPSQVIAKGEGNTKPYSSRRTEDVSRDWSPDSEPHAPKHAARADHPTPMKVPDRLVGDDQAHVQYSQGNGLAPTFQEHFIARGKIQSQNSTNTALAMMTFHRRGAGARKPGSQQANLIHIVAVASSTGNLKFYDTEGVHILDHVGPAAPAAPYGMEVPSKCVDGSAYIQSASFEISDDPSLVALWSNGCVVSYTFGVWKNGRKVSAPKGTKMVKPVADPTTEGTGKPKRLIDPTAPHTRGLALKVFASTVFSQDKFITTHVGRVRSDAELDTAFAGARYGESPVTSLAAFYFRGHSIVAVGHENGLIGMYNRNRTLLATVRPASARSHNFADPDTDAPYPITALARHGSILAFSAGRVVGLISLPKYEVTELTCVGTLATISSIHFDGLSPGFLWAATQEGDLLGFHTRFKADNSPASRCVAKYRWRDRQIPSNTQPAVVSARGYTIISSGSSISVHNATEVGAKGASFAFQEPLNAGGGAPEVVELDGRPIPALLSASSGASRTNGADVFVAVGQPDMHTVVVYESLLPYTHSPYDIAWMRGPLMVGGIILVVMYQFFKKRRSNTDFASMFNRDAPEEDDMAGFRERTRGPRSHASKLEMERMLREFEATQGRGQ